MYVYGGPGRAAGIWSSSIINFGQSPSNRVLQWEMLINETELEILADYGRLGTYEFHVLFWVAAFSVDQ